MASGRGPCGAGGLSGRHGGRPRDRDGEAGPGERYRDRRTDWLGWLLLPTEPARLDRMSWPVYEVRRVIWPGPTTPPARRTPPRSLHAVAAGNRAQMTAVLRKMAKAEGAGIQDEDGTERALAAPPHHGIPGRRALPGRRLAGPLDKDVPGFETAWQVAASAAGARPENQAGIRNGRRFRIPALRSAPFRGSGLLRLQGVRLGS